MKIVFNFSKILLPLFFVLIIQTNTYLFSKRPNVHNRPINSSPNQNQQQNKESNTITLNKEELKNLMQETVKEQAETLANALREVENWKIAQEEEKKRRQNEEEQLIIKKQIETSLEAQRINSINAKIENEEPISRKDDTEFNEGKQRKKFYSDLIKKLKKEKWEEVFEIKSFLKEPKSYQLTEQACLYFEKENIKPYETRSNDFIDSKIIETINDCAKLCLKLNNSSFRLKNISKKLSHTVLLSKNSLIRQIAVLNAHNNIEAAYVLLRLAKGLLEISEQFDTLGIYFQSRLQTIDNLSCWQTHDQIEYMYNSIDYVINNFLEILEETSDIVSFETIENATKAISNEPLKFPLQITKKNNETDNSEKEIEILHRRAALLATLEKDIITFSLEYGIIFTSYPYENYWPNNVPKHITQERKDKLNSFLSIIFQLEEQSPLKTHEINSPSPITTDVIKKIIWDKSIEILENNRIKNKSLFSQFSDFKDIHTTSARRVIEVAKSLNIEGD